jgi:hypothetical protein
VEPVGQVLIDLFAQLCGAFHGDDSEGIKFVGMGNKLLILVHDATLRIVNIFFSLLF